MRCLGPGALGLPAMLVAVAALTPVAYPAEIHGPASPPTFDTRPRIAAETGQAIYQSVCQGCHMADARGATGAGRYPALAANPRLAEAGYPVSMVVLGHNAMPAVGQMMSDDQVAAVVNYVRSHFGNGYSDKVKPEDVAALRPR